MRWFLVGLGVAACGSVDGGAKPDATVAHDAAIDTPVGQMLPASCKALHMAQPNMPSGNYMIDPDGAGPDFPLSVNCDMAIAGGGWTIVFFPPVNASLPLTYTSSTPRLLQDATQTLIAYRSASQVAYQNWATFDLPADWRTDVPFNYANTDVTVGISVNGDPLTTTTLRYGKQNFSVQCGDPWNAASDHGRICAVNTAAPFFTGFATSANDTCSKSNEAYNTTLCTADLRFSIAVR